MKNMNIKKNNKVYYNYPFHMVTISPWPLLISFSLMNLLISIIYFINLFIYFILVLNMMNLIYLFMLWMRDIIRESTYQGMHTYYIMFFLKFSMILFITSELFFFISFFWAYFHMFFSPSIEINNIWPPKGIYMFKSTEISLFNSITLLFSGFTLSISYIYMLKQKFNNSIIYMIVTLMLGILFMIIQSIEYKYSIFCFNDSIFGSLYFLMTGFHGFHVFIGLTMLFYTLIQLYLKQLSKLHHIIFEFSIWYWHFVDFVWLILYLDLYILNNI